jgi:uncharacterized lipoprotein
MMGRVFLLVIASLLIFGCSSSGGSTECYKKQEYQAAKPGPRVRVPNDMQPLPREERLNVPYGETQTEPFPKSDPCLVDPPLY